MDLNLTMEEANAVLDYEEFMRTGASDKKMSIVYFKGSDQLNHDRAVHILRYIFIKILHWTPEDVLNRASKRTISDLQLTIPYSKLIFPKEMSKKRDYYYMAKLLFPEEIHSFSKADITIHLYQQVLARQTNFPAGYFNDPKEGLYKASMCLRYKLSHDVMFRNIEGMYDFFADKKKAAKYLHESRLEKPCDLFFEGSALDYMDYSIPKQQADSLLYFNLKFHQVFDTSDAGKLWAKGMKCEGDSSEGDTDTYLDCLTLMEDLPDTLKSYIPTAFDMDRMEEESGKYMAFMSYMTVADRSGIEFDNEDKELLDDVVEELNDIIRRKLKLTDGGDR